MEAKAAAVQSTRSRTGRQGGEQTEVGAWTARVVRALETYEPEAAGAIKKARFKGLHSHIARSTLTFARID